MEDWAAAQKKCPWKPERGPANRLHFIRAEQYAQALFENGDRHQNIQRRAFEKAYAVFDRDDHDS